MEYILGIDQGATKTLAAIADVKGNIIGVGYAEGGYHAVTGEEHAMGEIKKATARACQMAGIPDENWAVIGAGLTGADFDYEYPLLENALRKVLKSDHITVINDCIAAFHAGTWKKHGAIVCAGTGLNCGIKSPEGSEFIYGYAIEDQWQGGSSIGLKALWSVFDADTGMKQPTRLTERILDYYKVSNASILLEKHIRKELQGHVKHLVPLVDECVMEGDACAIEIMTEFASMCAKYVIAGFKRFDMLSIESDLVLSGGIFKCKNDILYHVIKQNIHQEAPRVTVVDAKYEPVIGGVILGIEKLYSKIGNEIQENIDETAKRFGLIRSKK
jgi:N-acetylglucosamine kinase-like BadF-type ATPase